MEGKRGAATIPYNNGIICIKRKKGTGSNKKEYYTIPGGGQEEGESIEETTLREILEELGIEIELTNTCYKIENLGRTEYFFIGKYKSGELGTGKGEEMTKPDYEKYGSYTPVVVAKDDIEQINLLPSEAKNIILKNMELIFSYNVNN